MRITISLFILSVLIVYGGLLFPQTLLIEKKVEIKASSAHISDYLYDLPRWDYWLNWQKYQKSVQKLQEDSDTKYVYSKFSKYKGAFMKVETKGEKGTKAETNITKKTELYLQTLSSQNTSNQPVQKLKYIANFKDYQTHIEGEFEIHPLLKNKEHSTLNFTLKIDLGENPFVRYLAYLYYRPKIENETNESLARLKKLCEDTVLCKN